MPFAVLSFSATDTLRLGRFVLSAPQALKDYLEDVLFIEPSSDPTDSNADDIDAAAAVRGTNDEDRRVPDECYVTWNGNICVLSRGYYIDVHFLINKIEEDGWKIDQFSTSLTGGGVQCQTYIFVAQGGGARALSLTDKT